MDLRELEVWIDLGFDGDDFVFSVSRSRNVRRLGAFVSLGTVRGLLDSSRARAVVAARVRESFLDLVVSDLGSFGDVRLV
jgi:hypothetical protein